MKGKVKIERRRGKEIHRGVKEREKRRKKERKYRDREIK